MSSKRADGQATTLDMGAQYFTIRNTRFRHFLEGYAGFETFSEWPARLLHESPEGELESFTAQRRFVGTPRMSAIARSLSRHISVSYEMRVQRLSRDDDGWWIFMEDGQRVGPYDALVLTPPPAQAIGLLEGFPELQIEMARYRMLPCLAVALRFDTSLPLDFEGVQLVNDPILRWAGLNSSKPGRDDSCPWWVLHARPEWSLAHLDVPLDAACESLINAFRERFTLTEPVAETVVHRWRYAIPDTNVGPGHLWYADVNLGICGDWLSGGRVEGAFNSAESLLAHLRSEDRLGLNLH